MHRIAREGAKNDCKWRAARALRHLRPCNERTRTSLTQDAREHEVMLVFTSFMQNPVQRRVIPSPGRPSSAEPTVVVPPPCRVEIAAATLMIILGTNLIV